MWRWALAPTVVMGQSSSSASSLPNPPRFRMWKVKDSVASPLDVSRRGEISQGNTIIFLTKNPSFFCFTLLELPAGKRFVVPFPFGSAPRAPRVAHTSLNFSSHL